MGVMVNRGYKVMGLLVGLGMVCVPCYLQFPSLFSCIVFAVN